MKARLCWPAEMEGDLIYSVPERGAVIGAAIDGVLPRDPAEISTNIDIFHGANGAESMLSPSGWQVRQTIEEHLEPLLPGTARSASPPARSNMPYLGLRGIRLVLAISFTAGVSFCLFGIDNAALGGVISSVPCEYVVRTCLAALTFAVERQFNLSPTAQGAVTGSYELGCFASALTVSALGDRFSRRATLLACIVPLMIGAALQVSAFGVAQLTVGRVVAGLGMGGITSITPVWQNETSPAHLRGTLMCVSLSLLIVSTRLGYREQY